MFTDCPSWDNKGIVRSIKAYLWLSNKSHIIQLVACLLLFFWKNKKLHLHCQMNIRLLSYFSLASCIYLHSKVKVWCFIWKNYYHFLLIRFFMSLLRVFWYSGLNFESWGFWWFLIGHFLMVNCLSKSVANSTKWV